MKSLKVYDKIDVMGLREYSPEEKFQDAGSFCRRSARNPWLTLCALEQP